MSLVGLNASLCRRKESDFDETSLTDRGQTDGAEDSYVASSQILSNGLAVHADHGRRLLSPAGLTNFSGPSNRLSSLASTPFVLFVRTGSLAPPLCLFRPTRIPTQWRTF